MTIANVDKEGIHIIRTDGTGRILHSTVTGDDVVISVPPDGYTKVVNIYYDETEGKLVVVYEG